MQAFLPNFGVFAHGTTPTFSTEILIDFRSVCVCVCEHFVQGTLTQFKQIRRKNCNTFAVA